jgi:hypothetical protein
MPGLSVVRIVGALAPIIMILAKADVALFYLSTT